MLPGTTIILAVGAVALGLAFYLKVPELPMPMVTIIEMHEPPDEAWWNPRWGRTGWSGEDVWHFGKHSYTTRDLMGRKI